MRQQFPMQTKRLGNAVYRCSRDWLGKIITLAYTGSSPLMQTSSRRLRTARAAVDNTRPRKPAAVLAFDLFWQGGPKTSVAVRTRAASRADCISLRALAIATVRRKEHRARRRGIHLSTV